MKFDFWRIINVILFLMVILDALNLHEYIWPSKDKTSTDYFDKSLYNVTIITIIICGIWA